MSIIVSSYLKNNPYVRFSCKNEFIQSRLGGEILWRGCGGRTCPCKWCQEKHASVEDNIISVAHEVYPFTHYMRISPPHHLSDENKLLWLRQFLDKMREWMKENKWETFDGIFRPDLHENGTLHFNGIIRASKEAWRYAYQIKNSMPDYKRNMIVMPEMENPNGWIAYMCGRNQSHRKTPAILSGKQLISYIGNPYIISKRYIKGILVLRAKCQNTSLYIREGYAHFSE